MKNQLCIFLLTLALFISGCAASSPSTRIEQNTFISPDSPELKIEVAKHLSYISSAQRNFSPQIAVNSSYPVVINAESYIFRDPNSERILKISFEKLEDEKGAWEISLPDYSLFEDTIRTGAVHINGTQFSTGTFLLKTENGCFLGRTYAQVFGSYKNSRLQIHYTERIQSPSPTPEFIQDFLNRSDSSFIIHVVETALTGDGEKNADNFYSRLNAKNRNLPNSAKCPQESRGNDKCIQSVSVD